MTENHGYNAPERGATDWHLPLNDNFKQIDRDVEIRDVEGNLGEYVPKKDSKFVATNTGRIFFGNGSSWSEGGNISPVAKVIDPQENGIGIQRAADDLRDSGGTIRLKQGTYTIDSTIALYNGQQLVGAGMGNTVLEAGAVGGEGNVIISGETEDRNKRIRNLTIDAKNTGATCLAWRHAQNAYAVQCEFVNGGTRDGSTNSSGGKIRAGSSSDAHDFGFIECVAANNSAVSLDCGSTAGGTLSGSAPTGAVFLGNTIISCNNSNRFTHGLAVEGVDHSIVVGNQIDGRNQSGNHGLSPGINANSTSSTTITGNTIERAQKGIAIANGESKETVVANNTIYDFGGKTGIDVKETNSSGVWDNLIIGNAIDGAGGSGDGVSIGDNAHANVYNNVFRNIGGNWGVNIRSTPYKPCHIVGNQFVNWESGAKVISHDDDGTDAVLMIASNYVEGVSTNQNSSGVKIRKSPGVLRGNVFENTDENYASVDLSGGEWYVFSNYFERGLSGAASAQLNGNILRDGEVEAGHATRAHGNMNTGASSVSDGSQSYALGGPRQGEYTGNGATGRRINTFADPEHVVIEGPNGTKFDAHCTWGTGYQHDAPPGQLSLVNGGFQVGDGGENAHPNEDGVTYRFHMK